MPGLPRPFWLELAKKKSGKQYDTDKISELIKDRDINSDINGYRLNHMLYQLLDESSFLKDSYDLIIDKSQKLEPEFRKQFFQEPLIKNY